MAIVSTPEAEGAQALFCYIADVLGASKVEKEFEPYIAGRKSFTDFTKTYSKTIDEAYSANRVDTQKSKDIILKYLNNNKDWFISSLVIAQKVIKEISTIDTDFSKIKTPGWQSIIYKHGDKDIMDTISKLFSSANKQSAKSGGTKYFGDINKWSPADIYFGSKKSIKVLKDLLAEPETKKDNLTFAELNETIGDLIDAGELLPLSLKKVGTKVFLQKVNFSRKEEEKLLADTFAMGVKKWQPMNGKYKKGKDFEFTQAYSGGRDIRLLIKSGKKEGNIQIRHTPASGGKPIKGVKVVLMYAGASALGGQVVGIPLFTKIISTVDKAFAQKLSSTWDRNYNVFEKDANDYIRFGGGDKLYKSNDKKDKNKFNEDMGAISGLTVMNAIRPMLDEYFKKPGKLQHNVMRAIFAYVSSRTPLSSPFVIAKD